MHCCGNHLRNLRAIIMQHAYPMVHVTLYNQCIFKRKIKNTFTQTHCDVMYIAQQTFVRIVA